jgi:hypothetical protein
VKNLLNPRSNKEGKNEAAKSEDEIDPTPARGSSGLPAKAMVKNSGVTRSKNGELVDGRA